MLDSLLRVPNLCWRGRCFLPTGFAAEEVRWGMYDDAVGRFAVAQRVGDRVVLARDALGLNKLFFAIHEDHGVVAANYLVDLVARGVPFDAVYAVPAGSVIEISPGARVLRSKKFHPRSRSVSDLSTTLADVRRGLDDYFKRLRQQCPRAPVAVCLSGGLDSALVAALAREHFPATTAYTYSYADEGTESEDVALARETAAHLQIPHRLAVVGPADVLGALRDAVRFGQDWRDFNVHAAIVNVLLGDAIARDPADARSLRDSRPDRRPDERADGRLCGRSALRQGLLRPAGDRS